MAERFGNFFRKLGRRLLGKPTPPKVREGLFEPGEFVGMEGYGHGGIAAGNLKPGKQDLSEENVEKWRGLSKEEAVGFLEGEPLFVHSTNVAMAQYFKDAQKMMIEYKDGSAYLYSNMTFTDAKEFLGWQSKGGYVWDRLRVRGKGNARKFKKPFVKLRDKKAPEDYPIPRS